MHSALLMAQTRPLFIVSPFSRGFLKHKYTIECKHFALGASHGVLCCANVRHQIRMTQFVIFQELVTIGNFNHLQPQLAGFRNQSREMGQVASQRGWCVNFDLVLDVCELPRVIWLLQFVRVHVHRCQASLCSDHSIHRLEAFVPYLRAVKDHAKEIATRLQQVVDMTQRIDQAACRFEQVHVQMLLQTAHRIKRLHVFHQFV